MIGAGGLSSRATAAPFYVTSTIGVGSTFTVELPVAEAGQADSLDAAHNSNSPFCPLPLKFAMLSPNLKSKNLSLSRAEGSKILTEADPLRRKNCMTDREIHNRSASAGASAPVATPIVTWSRKIREPVFRS